MEMKYKNAGSSETMPIISAPHKDILRWIVIGLVSIDSVAGKSRPVLTFDYIVVSRMLEPILTDQTFQNINALPNPQSASWFVVACRHSRLNV